MASKVKDMTEGRPLGLIVSFALPLMAGSVFQQLYTVVDTMVVGKALGVDALAALGATDWLTWLIIGMVQGFTQGFGILISREFGARQYGELRRVVRCTVVLGAVCAAAFLVAAQLAAGPMLSLLNTPDKIRGGSMLYLRLMFLGIPVILAYNLLATVLRSLGDSQTPLTAMVLASLTNIVLDLVFVLVFRWGIAGAAIATLIAQVVSGVFCYLRLRKLDVLKRAEGDGDPDGRLAGRLMNLGWPMALQNGIIAVGGLIIQSVVNGYGVTFLAGYTATNKLFGLLELAAVSFGYAMITYAGQNLGAGKLRRIQQGLSAATVSAVVISLVICGFMLLAGRGILGLFLSGDPAEVKLAIDAGFRYLSFMSLGLPVLYVLHVVRSAVQGMGNTVLPMVSGIAEFVMRTGCVLILPAFLGEDGIYTAEIAAWAGADVILIPSFFITMAAVQRKMGMEEQV